ncbi:hypothetical protein [Streptomyces sp. NPDC059063]|uniref:hypothetical protein n=1 Tax=unclassified Streptomyces TaxID=2593676 RepID=UPI00368CB5C8
MGWTVLYIAFGVVALWLLGEVLLQYKARLRWRLLAFGGFLGVVVGVVLPSVVVIALGAVAFAAGQTYVTLSFRRGFAQGWALRGKPGAKKPGASRRRKAGSAPAQPTLQVSGVEYGAEPGAPDALDATTTMEPLASGQGTHEPEPLPDDTGQYGVYSDAPYAPPAAGDDYAFDSYAAAYGQPGAQGEEQLNFGYGDTGEQRYAAYSDPYIGPQTYGAQEAYAPYGGDTYGGEPYQDTPPGGVWVPHQRTGDTTPYGGEPLPEQPPYTPSAGGDGAQEPGNVFGYDAPYDGEQQYRY